MVRRPEPVVAVKDENFFFKVSRLVSLIVARPYGTTWQVTLGKPMKSRMLTKALDQAGLSPSVRGEALSLEEFASLADALKGQGL